MTPTGMKITVETIKPLIDIDVVHEVLRRIEEMNDYEKRLVAMGLGAINRHNEKCLPPKANELLWACPALCAGRDQTMKRRLTNAQEAIINLLSNGFTVRGIRYNEHSNYFRAECEYYPHPMMSTLNALRRMDLIEYKMLDENTQHYSLTAKGLSAGETKEKA